MRGTFFGGIWDRLWHCWKDSVITAEKLQFQSSSALKQSSLALHRVLSVWLFICSLFPGKTPTVG